MPEHGTELQCSMFIIPTDLKLNAKQSLPSGTADHYSSAHSLVQGDIAQMP